MVTLNHYLPDSFLNMFATSLLRSQTLGNVQTIADILQNLFTTAAIIIGAIWTYFKFFKGRTYEMRLEPEVTGRIFTINGLDHLLAAIRLKNVGLSKVDIEQKYSGLWVLSSKPPLDTGIVKNAAWDKLAAFPIFESHESIEPDEEIKEQRLIVIPRNWKDSTFQLKLWIRSGISVWSAMDIVTADEEQVDGFNQSNDQSR